MSLVQSFIRRVENKDYYFAPGGFVYELTPGIVVSLLQNYDELWRELLAAKAVPHDKIADLMPDYEMTFENAANDSSIMIYIDDKGMHIFQFDVIQSVLDSLTSGHYLTIDIWANRCHKSVAAAKRQCQLGRVNLAVKVGGLWLVPESAEYPSGRITSDIRVLQVPDEALTKKALMYLMSLSKQSMQNKFFSGEDITWPCKVDRQPDGQVTYRLSDLRENLFQEEGFAIEDAQLLPTSLINLLKYAIENDFDEIELICTKWGNQLIKTAWLDDGHTVYDKDNSEISSESLFRYDLAIDYAIRRSDLDKKDNLDFSTIHQSDEILNEIYERCCIYIRQNTNHLDDVDLSE